ncbi:MAG: class I SAM-dependent methyltransferase [Candidatus Acidiferrales bacterium]
MFLHNPSAGQEGFQALPHPDWNDSYIAGDMPWETGEPDAHLVEWVRSGAIGSGRALDVGCGIGTNAFWLAGQGFSVLGVDIASVAIEQARAKAAEAKRDCRFECLDFMNDEVSGGPFDLVFDRGCFHVFDEADDRERFASRVASLIAPAGRWLSLTGSTEGGTWDEGPPRRSLRDVADAIEPVMEILELRSIEFHTNLPQPIAAWLCLSRPRKVPARPSSREH